MLNYILGIMIGLMGSFMPQESVAPVGTSTSAVSSGSNDTLVEVGFAGGLIWAIQNTSDAHQNPVPEPTGFLVLSAGGAMLFLRRKTKKN